MQKTHRLPSLVLSALAACAFVALIASACAGGDTGTDCTKVVKFDKVTAFKTSCVSCHSSTLSGVARQGSPPDINFDTFESAQTNAADAAAQVQDGNMPLAGQPPLSDAEKADLVTWASCGTPQ